MHAAHIGSGKSVIAVVEAYQRFEHAYLFAPFHPVYLTFARDAKQIFEYATARV